MNLRRILLILSVSTFLSITGGVVYYYYSLRESALTEAHRRAAWQAEMIETQVSSFLADNLKPATALANSPEIIEVLLNPDDPEASDAVTNLVDNFRTALDAEICYLMNKQGVTIASSRRDIIGKNYGFRPYFTEAMAGRPAKYMALGYSTGTRGAYYTSPVYAPGDTQNPIGVVVVKAAIIQIENNIIQSSEGLNIMVGPQGIIFCSNREDLINKSLWELKPETEAELKKSLQFGKGPWPWTGMSRPDDGGIVGRDGTRYVSYSKELSNFKGWKVLHLVKHSDIFASILNPLIRTTSTIILPLFLLAGLFIFFTYKKASREINLRHLAEEELKQSEERYRSLYLHTPAMLHSIDASGRMISVSNYWRDHMGYELEEVENSKLTDFLTDESRRRATEEVIPDFFVSGVCQDIPYQFVKKNGEIIDVLLSAIADRGTNGEIKRSLAVVLDVTERLKAEKALVEAKEEAEAANLAKSEFMARMSHEIRTPMNAILGMGEVLSETGLTEDQKDYLESLNASGELLLGIINDILDFSKIESEQIQLEEIPFNLVDLVEDTARIMAVKAHGKGLELACHFDADLHPGYLGDPTRLKQILINLVGNAIKFTHQGEIVIRIEKARVENDPNMLLFQIIDTGIGIPSDKADTIFDSFTQADTSTTRKYGGTGLGLSICRSLINLMGGRIWVESQEGSGSVFNILLSLKPGDPAKKSPIVDLTALKDLEVLVVDDNATNRLIFREHLTRWGTRVTEAENGKAALARIARAGEAGKMFNLILLDYNMPGMNGLELAEKLKNLDLAVPPVTLMLSSTDNISAESSENDLGISSFLTKPVRRDFLLDAILATLDKARISPSRKSSPLDNESLALPPLSLLLAEDYQPNRKIIETFLMKTPVNIDFAVNGQIALDKYKTGTYDLVLMDVEMPVMDGIMATREIRKWEEIENIQPTPIVAFTAHVFSESRRKCLEAGCSGFISKPVKKKVLFETLLRFTQTEGQTVEPESKTAPSPAGVIPPGQELVVYVDKELEKVIHGYIRNLFKDLQTMIEALKKRDMQKIYKTSHNFKGSGSAYGLEKVSEIGGNLCRLSNQKDLKGIVNEIKSLHHFIKNVQINIIEDVDDSEESGPRVHEAFSQSSRKAF